MIGANHAAIAALIYTGVAAIVPSLQHSPIGLGVAALGGLLPDLDTPHSGLGRRFLLVSSLTSFYHNPDEFVFEQNTPD